MEDTVDKSKVSLVFLKKDKEYFAIFNDIKVPVLKTYEDSVYLHLNQAFKEYSMTTVINKKTNDSKTAFFSMTGEYEQSLSRGTCDRF